ncbi:hypothetical protein DXG01_007528 [Tephrocybe rancida]|nr:hypothetical protein DXG01_007528 [Tephrocybe rancida]
MSRLPWSSHKPSPFQFPRPPLSPPETNVDVIGPSPVPYSAAQSRGHELGPIETEPSPAHSAPTPESAGARFRKISSIAYHSSGLKESRERTLQRTPKAFVIIVPPSSLIQEHGQLGNTLASGPRHRLSNGLLMPLLPTMYGQLTAIAREFNFPSTTGLCLYPHFVENGVSMTPRISDESWPFLWAHIFETSPVPKTPISGKIEFDLDMRQARWYASWLSSAHRDNIEHPISIIPSAAPSFVHDRADSNTTFREDDQEEIPSLPQRSRHVPRKLSLVDRYDMLSARSGSRPASRSGLSPPENYPSSRVLSPIVQDEEPKTARQDLDSRVNTWRASAILKPTPLAATGQTSLEPANMPNSVPIDDKLLDAAADQLNLEDFDWSVTSAGPNDYDPMSPISWDRVPSVHIANRMEGSVCLTPSDCTSFGPSDYTLSSPEPSLYRLPSPDIAYRMFEDVPPTPSTATSWGAPLEFPASPVYFSRPPSVDLGERGVFSRPITPTTATSWGAASWPSSPVYTEHSSRSVHLGDRGDFSRPVTPSTATSWGAPMSYPPSPTTPFYVSTPDAGHRGFEDAEAGLWPYTTGAGNSHFPGASRRVPWSHSWPYTSTLRSRKGTREPRFIPWKHSWPYRKIGDIPQGTAHTPSAYPPSSKSQLGYPHFDLYPAVIVSTTSSQANAAGYPDFDLYPAVAPRENSAVQAPVADGPCYPDFDIYPVVYPENLTLIYPPVADYRTAGSKSTSDHFFELYPNSSGIPSQQARTAQALDTLQSAILVE